VRDTARQDGMPSRRCPTFATQESWSILPNHTLPYKSTLFHNVMTTLSESNTSSLMKYLKLSNASFTFKLKSGCSRDKSKFPG
jgi:hypothetical protein